jgi:hypothetical protein
MPYATLHADAVLPLTYAFSDTLLLDIFFICCHFATSFSPFAIASRHDVAAAFTLFASFRFAATPFRRRHAITTLMMAPLPIFRCRFRLHAAAAAAFVAFFSFDAAFILRLPPWRRYASLTS